MKTVVKKKKKPVSLTKFDKEFMIGWEVECFLNYSRGHLLTIFGDSPDFRDVEVDSDGSLRATRDKGGRGFELRTLPKKPSESFKQLQKLFAFINEFGYTNATCGLHLNISTCKEKHLAVNIAHLASLPLWNQITKAFKRANNSYCQPINSVDKKKDTAIYDKLKGKTFRQISMVATNGLLDHYGVLNFNCWDEQKQHDTRMELRAMGNTNYHKKIKSVSGYTIKTLSAIKHGFKLSK